MDFCGGPLPIKGMWIQSLLGNQDSTCYVVWPKDFFKKEKEKPIEICLVPLSILSFNFYSPFTDNYFFP